MVCMPAGSLLEGLRTCGTGGTYSHVSCLISAMIICMDSPAFHTDARGGISRYASLLASVLAQREEVSCVHLSAGWTRSAFAFEAEGNPKLRIYRMPILLRFVGGHIARLVSLPGGLAGGLHLSRKHRGSGESPSPWFGSRSSLSKNATFLPRSVGSILS